MAAIPIKYKRKLTELLGIGHARFGKVAHRRDYREDDGGEGGAGLELLQHPWLSNMPIGADSDLTMETNNSAHSLEAAEERVNEASNELKMQPALQRVLNPSFNPKLQT